MAGLFIMIIWILVLACISIMLVNKRIKTKVKQSTIQKRSEHVEYVLDLDTGEMYYVYES